uniref:F-actin-capping protein subunit beta n=1 Tax=Plectus sambesii TaxID=2011161 RepID=A0A914VEJ1_9BILA
MSEQQLDCGLDLMRRLPPQQCEKNLADLIDLVPSLCEDLLSSVDQPLKIAKDKESHKEYLLCDYNRDGDSYRSPWSNTYDPPIEDGAVPSERLRKLEIDANAAFESYRDMYFEGGVSSVYFWDLEHGFAGVVLIKKAGDGSKFIKGCWDSIHVIEVQEKSAGRQAHYKLTSTVMLWLQTNKDNSGLMNLGGSLTRQNEIDAPVNDQNPHLVNIGKMIEEMESKIRSTLNEIYFGKTKQIVSDLRSLDDAADLKKRENLVGDLTRAIAGKRQASKEGEV